MEMGIKSEEIEQIILGDSSLFSYTIKQVEITNVLGTAVAVLDEYLFTKKGSIENYILHRVYSGEVDPLIPGKLTPLSGAC